jgi:hypothetical protein
MFNLSRNSFKSKYIYLLGGFVIGVVSTSIFFLYGQQENEFIPIEEESIVLDDTIANNDSYLLDSIEVDDVSEDEESYVAETQEEDFVSKPSSSNNRTITKKPRNPDKSSNSSKNIDVSDVKDIARTLKGSSISAKTIIHEVNRIVTKENNSRVTGAVIAEALSHKLPKSTKNRLIKNVEYIAVSNNTIRVKLKEASNIKLTFKTDEGKKTIKVYDGATININNFSSKITADANGFSYQHLGMLWQIKNLVIQQKDQAGTLNIKLKGKLKNIDLPTITLGNLYRKIL